MNRAVFSIAVLVAMLVAGGGLYFLTRSAAPAPAAPVAVDRDMVPEAPRGSDVAPAAPAEPAPTPRAFVPPRTAAPLPVPEDPTTATLRIDSDVAGAQVFIDRDFIGHAPVTARNLAPGTHRLNVDAPGYDGVLQMIDVQPGSTDLFVRLREVRLDASIPVVHKHRIGSCRGQLTATARGLRYAATEGNDSFDAALTDLEQFEVDYLENNLRVRAGGRQYDFTDPEGNADRLFVFHRDVDSARMRLAAGDPPAVP